MNQPPLVSPAMPLRISIAAREAPVPTIAITGEEATLLI